jgi:hypothetical protein
MPSILEAVPPPATWGRAMPWWQGPTYHGNINAFLSKREFVNVKTRETTAVWMVNGFSCLSIRNDPFPDRLVTCRPWNVTFNVLLLLTSNSLITKPTPAEKRLRVSTSEIIYSHTVLFEAQFPLAARLLGLRIRFPTGVWKCLLLQGATQKF